MYEILVRCRLVATVFEGNDKDRVDLFAETHLSEAKRLLLSSGTATRRRRNGRMRKAMCMDAKQMVNSEVLLGCLY